MQRILGTKYYYYELALICIHQGILLFIPLAFEFLEYLISLVCLFFGDLRDMNIVSVCNYPPISGQVFRNEYYFLCQSISQVRLT